ncbi:MAG: hypothetical protein HZA15_09885 [Nitrospirae bacterium]|nr:hypothetical protein [Nitrospirota bacterium]
MGEYQQFQPLTKEDKITTVLYRSGIFLSTVLIAIAAFLAVSALLSTDILDLPLIYSGLGANIIILSLYFSVGLSVFFIHLYIGKFHRILKKIYYLSVFCLVLMFLLGKGSPVSTLFRVPPAGALLLIPLSCCLGFITAKEAFCFKLLEGYLLGMIMPAYLFVYGMGLLEKKSAAFGIALIAAMLVLFMFRKVFMPLHCDIGDKSAYQP